ncbi:MAG: MMPL family transporter [Pseudomonadota bacterium]
MEQLRDGPVSRLILIGIEGAGPARTRLSRDLAQRLRSDASFRSVQNGEPVDLDRDRELVFKHRYLLSERVGVERFSAAGLRDAIQEGIEQLSSPMGFLARDLFVRDPTGETLEVLDQLERSTSRPKSVDGVWVSPDESRALLVAETRAAGSDSDSQEHAIAVIRSAFAAVSAETKIAPGSAILRLTGPGVFADEARSTIKREAVRLSILNSILIAAFLLVVYRSVPVLVLGLLPVACGALAGVAAVELGFGVVHGVTLGFGVTLIGEAVDYSIYLFLQVPAGSAGTRDASAWTIGLWPTIRLGLLTSVCGFASLLPSAFPGLAQLGLYSIAGLVTAGLVTRFVLPALIPRGMTIHSADYIGAAFSRALVFVRRLRVVLWSVPILAALVLYTNNGRVWNRDLSALSPVSPAAQTLDAKLRADLGAPDVGTLVIVSGRDTESVLRATESVGSRLQVLVDHSVIAGFQSPAVYLPSLQTQQRRRASLPTADELRKRLQGAAEVLDVRADKLAPFVEDVAAARIGPLINRADLKGTNLAAGVDALLVRNGTQWNAMLPLRAITTGPGAFTVDIALVRRTIAAADTTNVEVSVMDLKQASDGLYANYLTEATRMSMAGLVAILVLLSIALRSATRVARVVTPLILAVLGVMSGLLFAGHALTILHLVGLLLVFAIGSNYALFFARETTDADVTVTNRVLASLLIANVTTVIGFGTLAFSSVPVLAAVGSTVAPGAFLALLFSAALAGDHRYESRRA